MIFIQYRGVITDRFVQRLKETGAPIKPKLTLRKIKTVMPSLKQKVDKVVTSNLIYKFKCPNCQVSYVGMTTRHLCTRVNEHRNYKGEQAVIRSHTQESGKGSNRWWFCDPKDGTRWYPLSKCDGSSIHKRKQTRAKYTGWV